MKTAPKDLEEIRVQDVVDQNDLAEDHPLYGVVAENKNMPFTTALEFLGFEVLVITLDIGDDVDKVLLETDYVSAPLARDADGNFMFSINSTQRYKRIFRDPNEMVFCGKRRTEKFGDNNNGKLFFLKRKGKAVMSSRTPDRGRGQA